MIQDMAPCALAQASKTQWPNWEQSDDQYNNVTYTYWNPTY